MADLAESYRMLDTFASVGATHFDVTFIDIDGEKCGFRKEQTARQLRNSLPHLLPGLTARQQNFIIRPYGEGVHFVQLDDLDYDAMKPIAPVACLIIETSPGNHQAWVAISDLDKADAKDFARRLRKGTGADPTASGATRMASTLNYKRKYEPDFPEVTILQAAPGRQTTKAQLESLNLLAPPAYDAPASPIRVSSFTSQEPGPWPDYARCLRDAPINNDKSGPDVSRADFTFSLFAARRHRTVPEIEQKLIELSPKAKSDGQRYVQRTARNAVSAYERERERQFGRA